MLHKTGAEGQTGAEGLTFRASLDGGIKVGAEGQTLRANFSTV